jgi:uncharacterized protein
MYGQYFRKDRREYQGHDGKMLICDTLSVRESHLWLIHHTPGCHRTVRQVILMPPVIEEHLEKIQAIARSFGVDRLEVFGSVCTAEFDPGRSDIDFLVSYPPNYDFGPWLARLQDLELGLRELLGHDVDVVTTTASRNKWFRREANKTRTVVYDASEVAEVA